jgi:hypothetical protein
VALLWNHEQKWDGVRRYPSARFVSPNADEGMRNHRMGLFLPSVPDFVPENADRAKTSYRIPAGKRLALEASVLVTPGHPLAAVREWYRDTGGIPAPGPWPRGYEEAVALCRTGFLQTVWNDRTNRWRHCIEFPESHAPGFAALLWMDAHLAPGTEGGRLSAERVDRVAKVMLEDAGPPVFTSMAACHIMRWEFPFLYGCLPEALPGIEPMVNERIRSQGAEGGWRFHTDDAQRADLGQRGDTVSGYNAHNAWILARYGRVTGDRRAIEAAEKALRFIERFRVPRGAGPWECPIYEPDVLAATWLLAACLEGFRATGNPRYLYDAVYWAESSLPFVYPWQLPDRPMMLGASLPVFGSTFYTHSWLGMPVQWEGLTLAYHLRHLADDLERARPRADGSPLRPLVGLSPADWRRMADLLTVSGLHQQVESGERVGTYPDSITDFQKRNPVFINPENILVNLFAMRGHDPDIKTARARRGEREITVSSGAAVEALVADGNGVRFRLKFFPGENSHTLIAGCEPTTVQVNGLPLPRSASPVRREPGWWWDRARQRAYLVILHATEEVSVELAAR